MGTQRCELHENGYCLRSVSYHVRQDQQISKFLTESVRFYLTNRSDDGIIDCCPIPKKKKGELMSVQGWISPRKKFIEVEPFCHAYVRDHNAEAAAVNVEPHDSVHENLFNSKFIHVREYNGAITFEGRARVIADAITTCERLADLHGLTAKFERI